MRDPQEYLKTIRADGQSDHTGSVEKFAGGMITSIEGNQGEKVGRRVIPLGCGNGENWKKTHFSSRSIARIRFIKRCKASHRGL